MSEFDMIAEYFQPLTMGRGALDNDTASLIVPAGQELVVTSDMLHEGVHFFAGTSPEIIAQKMLRSNLSDLASSGAEPFAYSLSVGFASMPDATWLKGFCDALLTDQKASGIYCCGGDTTSTKGGMSLNVTALGLAPQGSSVRRDGVRAGDVMIVTGEIGHGVEAFRAQQTIAPPMRNAAGAIVQRFASAAIDVSDGLVADVGHIARASRVRAEIVLDDVPVTGDPLAAITGGDDYEIVMALAPESVEACLDALKAQGMQPAVIGSFAAGAAGVHISDKNGVEISIDHAGWAHF